MKEDFKQLCSFLPSAAISCHATTKHCSHSLKVKLEDISMKDYECKPLKIECIQRKCGKGGILETEAPIELISALTIIYHSSHEGHRLRITFDGKSWESPE